MFFTVCASSLMTEGAVNPRPSFSNAALVAILTILDAKAGPYSKSQSAHTDAVPARISPMPPHLFLPPSVRTMNDRSLPKMMSLGPLIINLKCGNACLQEIYVISSLESLLRKISSRSIL